MFDKILIANRGEIALRVIRAAREMGIKTVAVHSTADSDAMHVRMADESDLHRPAAQPAELPLDPGDHLGLRDHRRAGDPSRLRLPLGERQVRADRRGSRPDLHRPHRRAYPHHGRQDHRQGHDEGARRALRAGLATAACPTWPPRGRSRDEIGYPVIIKATAGGGGRGMKVAQTAADMERAFQTARAEAKATFGNDEVYIEKYLTTPRHIEIQVFGDGKGGAVHLGERDCSLQRRHQKVLRRGPGPRDHRRGARADRQDLRRRGGPDRLCRGRHHRVPLRERRVLLHRDEHPPAGRAPGDRGDLRRRPGARADPRGRRPADVLRRRTSCALNGHAIEVRINAEKLPNFSPCPGRITPVPRPGRAGGADGFGAL